MWGTSRFGAQTYVLYRLFSRMQVVVSLFFMYIWRDISCGYVLLRHSRGCSYTRMYLKRAVWVYKSDLIALDDSSANIRALTVDAWTFISFRVVAADGTGQCTILEWLNFAMTVVRHVVFLLCITTTSNLIVKRLKMVAVPRDIVFSRKSYENLRFFSSIFPRYSLACFKCTCCIRLYRTII